MVLPIQILGVLFGIGLIYVTFLHQRKHNFDNTEFVFWILSWIVFIFIALFPSTLDFITATLSIVRTMDLLVIVGFMFLLALTYHNYVVVRKSSKDLEKLVRRLAIRNVRIPEKPGKL